MKRKVLTLLLALTMFSAMSITAFADGGGTVTFTGSDTLEYTDDAVTPLSDAFKGVAPGEKKTVEIKVENANKHTSDFYISAAMLEALDEGKATGAGYDVELSVEKDGAITPIYNSKVGGYINGGNDAGSTGIAGIEDSLSDDIMFATLKNGESVKILFSIAFDGEAMDKNGASDYTEAMGQLAFNFKAGYKDPSGTTVIVREVTEDGQVRYVRKIIEIIEGAVPLGAVATGDGAMIGLAAVVLLVGGSMIIIGRKKKAEE